MSRLAARDPLVGSVVAGRYLVLRLLGAGGMGSVYEVEHRALGRRFAVKKLAPALIDDREALARFRREAEVVARFRHPNIVEVIDWETLEDGSPCIVMELLEGEDLAARLRRGPLAWSAIAVIADQVLAALVVAHAAGVVHRDVKPQNIFLARDDAGGERVKILDFGVSKVAGAVTAITVGDRVIGTPRYMAPEQADPELGEVGPAADVWAVAAVLHEMATGREPFPAPSTMGTLFRIRHGAPEPLLTARPDAPPEVVRILSRALDRDPGRRLTIAAEMRRDLAAAFGGEAARAVVAEDRPPTTPPPATTASGSATPRTPVVPVGDDQPTTLGSAAGETLAPRARPRGRRLAVATAVLGAGALVAVAFAATGSGRRGARPASAPSTAPHAGLDAARPAIGHGGAPDAAPLAPAGAPDAGTGGAGPAAAGGGDPSADRPRTAPGEEPPRRKLHPRGAGRDPYAW